MVVRKKWMWNQYALKADGKGQYLIVSRGEVYKPELNIGPFPLENALRLIRWYEQADKWTIASYIDRHMAHWIL